MGYGKDFLTGEYGHVERHHIFGGALRSKSERYGLVVELSPWMHREGPKAAHRCKETKDALRRYGQKKVMLEQDWGVDTFIREFGKNYLDDVELAYIKELQESCDFLEPGDFDDWDDNPHESEKDAGYDAPRTAAPMHGFRVTLEVLPY